MYKQELLSLSQVLSCKRPYYVVYRAIYIIILLKWNYYYRDIILFLILVDYAGALELVKMSARPICVSFSRSESNVRDGSSIIANESDMTAQIKGGVKSDDQVFHFYLLVFFLQLTWLRVDDAHI